MRFSGFESLIDRAKSLGRAKVAVAAAADKEVLEAVKLAEKEGLITMDSVNVIVLTANEDFQSDQWRG
jgi:peptidyl-tRNA hydrolase